MRQAKKEIKSRDVIIALLNRVQVGRLGTLGGDGYPMVKPLNFAHSDGKIYFHSAREGEKIEDIRRNNRVCFEVDLPLAQIKSLASPCRSEYLYRSVIIKGRAHVVEDAAERIFGLKKLMEKYQPEGGYGDFPEEKLKLTSVIRIDIEAMTGKEDLGKETVREAVLQALEGKAQLPVVLTQG